MRPGSSGHQVRSLEVLCRTSAVASARSRLHPSTNVTPATRTIEERKPSRLPNPLVTRLMCRQLNRLKPVGISVGEPQQHRNRLDLNLGVRISLKQRHNCRSHIGGTQLLGPTGFARQSMESDGSNRSDRVRQGS